MAKSAYLRSVMRFVLLSGYHATPPETLTRSSRPLGSWTTDCSQRILIVVAVEESIELIAADARADGTRGSVLGKAFACEADVLVATVVAECVVYLLEVVEVEHQKRRVAELFG